MKHSFKSIRKIWIIEYIRSVTRYTTSMILIGIKTSTPEPVFFKFFFMNECQCIYLSLISLRFRTLDRILDKY